MKDILGTFRLDYEYDIEYEYDFSILVFRLHIITTQTTGSPSSLYEPRKEHNMASSYKGLYGIFYKISMKVVESENIQ